MTFQVSLRFGKTYTEVDVDYKVFNGGEINLRLPEELLGKKDIIGVSIMHKGMKNSNDLMALLMLNDALRRAYPRAEYRLGMGYVPYARQDRVCNDGEAHSMKVFGNLINTMGFDEVLIIDPHSDVAGACIDNCTSIVSQVEVIESFEELQADISDLDMVLISPDAGAIKKSEAVAVAFEMPLVQGVKQRDLRTGALSGFAINDPRKTVEGRNCLIVDDICDGGGTFLGLAKVLFDNGALSVSLYVTHGIFSQGVSHLLDNGIDRIYTLDTFNSGEQHERLEICTI